MTEDIEPSEFPDVVADPEAPAVLNLQRRLRIMLILAALGLALMAWLWINSSSRDDQIDSLIDTNKAQQVLIDKLATALDIANTRGAEVPAPEVIAAAVPGAEVSPVESPAPGLPGERGDAGPVGATGTGAAGATGDVGTSGSKGDPGVAGDTGDTGTAGTNGVNGAQGGSGPAGAQGDPGPAGPQGDPGVAGPEGPAGASGPSGPMGPIGGMPVTYQFTFNGVAYTCTQIATGSTTYDCTVNP